MTARPVVRLLAGPAVCEVRELYLSCPSDVLRIAALTDVAGAAATLARTIARFHPVDLLELRRDVADPVDLLAALGRGQWLPTMVRHVPAPPRRGLVSVGGSHFVATARRASASTADQIELFDLVTEGR
jgi:hypothetical protein